MPDPFHKYHFLNGTYPRPRKRLGDMLPKQLASLKTTNPLDSSATTLVVRIQIICRSVQIADFASQVTSTRLNTRVAGREKVSVVCELIVLKAVFPIVER